MGDNKKEKDRFKQKYNTALTRIRKNAIAC
jgi:hypothetical protein